MTTDPAWDTRWRDEAHYKGHYYDTMQAPQPPAPGTDDLWSQNAHPAVYSDTKSWDDRPASEVDRHQARGLPSMMEPYTDASTYRSRLHQRHSPSRRSSISNLTNSPPRQNFTGTWQSLPLDQRAQHGSIPDAPLTLHIPKTQGKYNTTFLPDLSKSHGLQCCSPSPSVLTMWAL